MSQGLRAIVRVGRGFSPAAERLSVRKGLQPLKHGRVATANMRLQRLKPRLPGIACGGSRPAGPALPISNQPSRL